MRGRRHLALLAHLAVCAIVIACASPTTTEPATPGTPVASPEPTTPAGVARPWTYAAGDIRGVAFGRDAVVYLFSWYSEAPSQLVALDDDGAILTGWPVDLGRSGIGAGPLELADGSVAVLTFSYETGVESYALNRIGPDGKPIDGWPYLFAAGRICSDIQPLATGDVVVACGADEGTTLTAIDPNGDVAWEAATDVPTATDLALAGDGTIYGTGLGSDGGVAAFDASGAPLAGWPVRIPDLSGATLTPDGRILAWWRRPVEEICLEAVSTTYLVLDASGTPVDGWPQTLEGYASDPVVGLDGAVHVVTKRNDAFAFDADGTVRAGWPAGVSGRTDRCFGPSTPVLGPDGTLYVASGGPPPGGALSAISPAGRAVDGWPFAPVGELAYPCRMGCTPGPAEPSGPIVLDDRAWIATYPDGDGGTHVEVMALDGAGRPIADSTIQLATQEASLMVSPDGRLFAALAGSDSLGEGSFAFLGPAR